MILTALVILTVLATAYIWGARGMFSALVHMVCTIIAGAIAFAAWEPVTDILMNFSNGAMVDWAHGLGLALPFAISLTLLRLATNSILPKNVDLDGITNMVGGAVCGVIAGVITTGIFIISLGYLRFENTLMGYEPLTYANNGSLVRTSSLLVPVDRLTGSFYSAMSTSTLRTEENLAKWHPDIADEGPALRMNFDEGKSRHVHKPKSFEVLSLYSVDTPRGVFNDSFEPTKKRTYTYTNGDLAPEGGTSLVGVVGKFAASANEKSGRVIVGASQVRLIADKGDGTTMAIHPAAVLSEAEPPANPRKDDAGKHPKGRWAYDAQKTFISTVGGRNESPMAFEFPVPKGATPIGLYVKGIRTELADVSAGGGKYTSTDVRDRAIETILSGVKAAVINPAGAFQSKGPLVAPNLAPGNNIPFNLIFQKDDLSGLTIDDTRKLVDGEGRFNKKDIQGRNSEPALQVRQLACPEDQVIIHVIVDGRNRDWGFVSDVGNGIDLDKAPVLADEQGTPYSAFGYVYETGPEVHVILHPDAPVQRVNDMPVLTRSKPDDKLVLLFRVGKNQKIKYFAVGEKALLDMTPPFETGGR